MASNCTSGSAPPAQESRSLEVALGQLRLMGGSATVSHPGATVGGSGREPVALEPLVRDVLGLVGPAGAHAKIEISFEASRSHWPCWATPRRSGRFW